MKTRRILTCAVLGIIFGVANLYAAQINFTPELFVSEEYTDNLFLTHNDDAKVDDYITEAGVSLTGEALWRTAGLEINYTPAYYKYADNSDLDFWRHEAYLNVWKVFRRNVRLELSNTFLETEDPRDETEGIVGDDLIATPAIGVDPTRRGRNRYRSNVAELRLTHQFAANSSYYAGVVQNTFRDIDAPPAGEARDDFDAVQPIAGIEYWFTPRWGILLDAYLSDRDYKEREDRREFNGVFRLQRSFERHLTGFIEYRHTKLQFEDPDGASDYQIYAPALGIEYLPGINTSIDIAAGYYLQEFEDEGLEDENGFNIQSTLSHTWPFKTGNLTVVGLSGYDVADTGAEDLGLRLFYAVRVTAQKNFTNHLLGDIFASYRVDDYTNETPDRTDRTAEGGVGLEYQALKWMILRLEYERTDVSSDIEVEEFTENKVLFTIRLVPSSPFRLK